MSKSLTSDDFIYNQEIPSLKDLFYPKIKFYPPKPSYKIISQIKESSSLYDDIDYEILSSIPFNKFNIPDWINVSFHSINYKKNKKLIFMHIQNNYNKKYLPPNKVILYSHENNTDLIRLLPFLIDLSIQNKCNIISYDYRGFGCSSSKSSEKNFTTSYEYAINFALNYLNYKIENILLMGRDIGAIHSIIIASRHKYNMCKGLILISPIINEKIIDINIMKSIICPTLLIKEKINDENNKEDDELSFYRQINNEKEWFPKNKNKCENNFFYEQDILLNHRSKLISYIREYMKSNNDDKIIRTLSRESTNTETLLDNNEIYFDLENQNEDKICNNKSITQNNNKRNYMKEFEEEDNNINYNNEDDY